MTTFKVHFANGLKLTVTAPTPADARKQASAKHDGVITKVKQVRI